MSPRKVYCDFDSQDMLIRKLDEKRSALRDAINIYIEEVSWALKSLCWFRLSYSVLTYITASF